jgi:hypothetical protein
LHPFPDILGVTFELKVGLDNEFPGFTTGYIRGFFIFLSPFSFEAYYRLQITEQLALTPDIQYLVDPAQNPTEDSLWIFGLRARVAL